MLVRHELIHYNKYILTTLEKIKYAFIGFLFIFLLSMLFYNNIFISIIFSMVGLLYPIYIKSELMNKRKSELKSQFKECIYTLSASLRTGKSIESALKETLNDMKILYTDSSTYIIRELEVIIRRIEMNEIIEDVLQDFAKRAEVEEITNFSDVFITAKRTGGDLISIINYTTSIINEKIEIQQEIEVLITSKQFEQRILTLLVPLIIVYLQVSSPGYLNVMYTTITGRILMTIALILYLFSYILGKKITEIEV